MSLRMAVVTASHDIYPWLSEVWQPLCQQYDAGLLPPALLLNGQAGLGKHALAKRLAAYILCGASEQFAACGDCKSCRLLASGTHPDFHLLEPEEAGRAIKIEPVRQLNHALQQTSQLGGFKVAIIDPADALNLNGANALLKTLEEPPENTLFLLITSNLERILPTVRSRCLVTNFNCADEKMAIDWLSQQLGESEKAPMLLSLAGSPLRALAFSREQKIQARDLVISNLLSLQQHKSHPVDAAQALQGIELTDILDWIYFWVCDVIKFSTGVPGQRLKNQDILESVEKSATQLSLHGLYLYLDKVQQVRKSLLSGHNPNRILLLEDLLLNWREL